MSYYSVFLDWIWRNIGSFGLIVGSLYGSLYGQKSFPEGIGLETSLHYGRILRHTPKITLPITRNTWGLELSWEKAPKGEKAWEAFAKYPRFGLMATFFDFGSPQVGIGLGVAPHISKDFIRTRNDFFSLYGRFGMGLGYVSRPYHPVSNPHNNIVSSHLNAFVVFRLGMRFRLSPHLDLRPSFSFSHYSNGASQLPNYGINVTSAHLGLCWTPQPVQPEARIPAPDSLPRDRKLYGHFETSLGFRESTTYGGAKFPVWQAMGGGAYFISRICRLRVGLDYEYNGAVAAFLANVNPNIRPRAWESSRLAAYTGFELVWGRVSMGGNFSFYLTENALLPWFMYVRILTRYYFCTNPSENPKRLNPYLFFNLKAHKIVAEYFSFGLGMSF